MGASLEIAERLANHFELKVTDLFSPNRSWLTAAIAEKPPARRRTEAA
jgi:DNA-binding XRE family transcriptional regulator